jgi:hypothetical protein
MFIEAKVVTVKDKDQIEVCDDDNIVTQIDPGSKIPDGNDPDFNKCVRDIIGTKMDIDSTESITVTDCRKDETFVESLASDYNLLVRK